MKAQVIQQLNDAIKSIQDSDQIPSQLMLDLQTVLNEPEVPVDEVVSSKPEGHGVWVDLSHTQLKPAVQRLLNCGALEATRYINVIKRSADLMVEMQNEANDAQTQPS